MFTILIGAAAHNYRPLSLSEAQSVARELSRDYPGTLVTITRENAPFIDYQCFRNGRVA